MEGVGEVQEMGEDRAGSESSKRDESEREMQNANFLYLSMHQITTAYKTQSQHYLTCTQHPLRQTKICAWAMKGYALLLVK